MVVLHRFAQHQADVLTLAASADGELLLSSGVDAKVDWTQPSGTRPSPPGGAIRAAKRSAGRVARALFSGVRSGGSMRTPPPVTRL